MSQHLFRFIEPRIHEALADTAIVVIQGARQVGKTTLLRKIVAEKGGRELTLDDEVTRTSAENDPVGFVSQYPRGLLAIDEVQRVPSLILALKLVADRNRKPGRFLLTGSANLLRLPTMEDSLAGRAESIELHGFSQGELGGQQENFLDRLLSGERFLGHTSALTRQDYLYRAISGSYPEALARTSRRRNQWLDNYLTRIIERDAPDISHLQRLAELPLILRILATRNSDELNLTSIARDSNIPTRTLAPHLDLLETLYLIQRIPAWKINFGKRAVSRPKVALLDTGLAARLLGINASGASVLGQPQIAGKLLEGFVAGELRRGRGWATENLRISHYRDHSGEEIDFIIETDDGRIAAIEVKASSSIGKNDAKWLSKLRDRLGSRFTTGIVLHTGASAGPLGEKISAVPLDVLWVRR